LSNWLERVHHLVGLHNKATRSARTRRSELMTTTQRDAVALAGRVLLAVIFIISGWGKLTGFSATAESIADKGLPLSEVLTVIAIAVELGAGLAIVFGWKTRWAALAMVVFLVVITPIFHAFWNVPADQVMMQQINFMKNLSILGGMLVLFAWGPGRYSLDEGRASLEAFDVPRRRATDMR
jgi:putative oxidoreductase